MPGKDVFLSYASADRDRIRPLVSVLEDSGWTVFWDRTIPAGKTWREVVGKELENCRSVVVAWSQTSIKSDWVLEEAERGRRSGILVPVRIDDVDPPLGFGAIQAADLFDWNGQSSAPQSQRFVRDLSMVLGEPPITKAAVERRHDEAAAAGPRPAEVRVAEKARQELQERERLQAERSTGPFYEEPQSVSSRRLRRMTITLAAVGLVIIASALYWAYGPMQPKSSFGPDESRVELLLRVNTADEQVVESVEHTIRERLGGLRLRKWSLSREDAPSAQLRLLEG